MNPLGSQVQTWAALLSLAMVIGGLSAQGLSSSAERVQFSPLELRRIAKLSPLPAAPLDGTNRFDGDPRAERLGHLFFWEERFSSNGKISCGTCHDPALEFSDARPVAEGLALGKRRTPSLWNVSHSNWFFHDGRADSLWAQALGPLENPIEMGTDRLAVLHVIAGDGELRGAFEALAGELPPLEDRARFPEHARPDARNPSATHRIAWDGMLQADQERVNRAFSDVGKMVAAFERRLVKKDSAFDRFALSLREGRGPQSSYPQSAQRGLRLFLNKGNCRLCHNGPNFSDGEFHALGLGARGGGMPTDAGRYLGIPLLLSTEFGAGGKYSDEPNGERAQLARGLARGPASWGEFKTPSLRNVAKRGPYMHAGQFDSLGEVLGFYSTLEGAAPLHQHQEQVLVPREFTERERRDLEAFLGSLEGVPEPGYWTQPAAENPTER